MKDLDTAVKYLNDGGYTCVLCKGERIYSSKQRGVKPLIDFIESDKTFEGFSAADKVVGKGAAFLYVLLGVKYVWAEIMSEKAKAVFEENGINIYFETLVPAIQNRAGTGFCPVEQAVETVASPQEALAVIHRTLENLISQQSPLSYAE